MSVGVQDASGEHRALQIAPEGTTEQVTGAACKPHVFRAVTNSIVKVGHGVVRTFPVSKYRNTTYLHQALLKICVDPNNHSCQF